MGYRSDVTIIMYPKFGHRDKFAALKLYVDENLPDQFEVVGGRLRPIPSLLYRGG